MAKFTTNVSGAILLPSSIQVTESISGSVEPLAMFFSKTQNLVFEGGVPGGRDPTNSQIIPKKSVEGVPRSEIFPKIRIFVQKSGKFSEKIPFFGKSEIFRKICNFSKNQRRTGFMCICARWDKNLLDIGGTNERTRRLEE